MTKRRQQSNCLNHDGQFDPGDVSAVTSSGGTYTFSDVTAGTYAVKIVNQPQYRAFVSNFVLRISPGIFRAMKALSIKQPWASLIAAGVKTLEIRQWPTDHRGPLLIVSSRRPVIDGHRHGQALCIVNVVDCRRMTRDDPPFACIPDFYFDHYAWVLRDVKLITPFGVMGQLRLFDVPDNLIKPAGASVKA